MSLVTRWPVDHALWLEPTRLAWFFFVIFIKEFDPNSWLATDIAYAQMCSAGANFGYVWKNRLLATSIENKPAENATQMAVE